MNLLSFLSQPTNHAARRAAAMPRPAALVEPETVPASPLYALPAAQRGTPEAMRSLYYNGCQSMYSAEFKAGFWYMANVLCNAPAVRDQLPMPSARYDAYLYGMQQAQELAQSAEWKAIAS